VAAFAATLVLGGSAFGATQFTETFDTAASATADGWTADAGATTPPNNFGFSPTNNAGGTAGEAGGHQERTPLGHYRTSVGSLDPSTETLTMSGLSKSGGTNDFLVWMDNNPGRLRGGGATGIGFRQDDSRFILFVGEADVFYKPGVRTIGGDVGATSPTAFTFTYDPADDGTAHLFGSVTYANGGNIPFDVSTNRITTPLTLFGMSTLGESSGSGGDTFYDNLSYTTAIAPVPEPASLGLLSVGALGLLRRRRHA
jgi:hypothetical protein